jgi:tetraacyldisaccharide 4'-kinase
MKLNKPKFWDVKNSFISILLYPFSFLVLLYICIKKKLIIHKDLNIPIVCVGNIYLGGTGKTPTSIFLAKELLKLGKNPVIIRKFYQSHKDEYELIKKQFGNILVNKNRVDAIQEAKEKNYDSVILDDGFQDYKIKKNSSILCFNYNQLIGNELVIPAGPLREGLSSLKLADIVLINGGKNNAFEKKILNINQNLEIFYSHYKPTNIEDFKNKKLLAVAGIGNPINFFQLIEDNSLKIEKKIIFPDHYEFTEEEVIDIVEEAKNKNYHIITTEKDYFKIKNLTNEKINFLKISLEIHEKKRFLKAVSKIYD